MKIVIQRVQEAHVDIDGRRISKIGKGLLLFVCIEKGDAADRVQHWARRIVDLRIFSDSEGKMNLSIKEVLGEILVVSQFTLAADLTEKGRRPSFSKSESPDRARECLQLFTQTLRDQQVAVHEGQFGADMKVSLINDGPVTFTVDE